MSEKINLQNEMTGDTTPSQNAPGGNTSFSGTPWAKFKDLMQRYKIGEFFQKYTMTIALFIVVLVFYFWSEEKKGLILMPGNIRDLIGANAYVFILATGMLLCILTGGNIDLSVGSVLCFSGAAGCVLINNGWNIWLVAGFMLLIGLAVGAFQGFWIAKIRVPAFIATLAGMYAFRGLASILLNGQRADITNVTFLKYFGVEKYSYIPDFVRDWFPELKDTFTKKNEFMKWLIGENFVTNFNVTCACIGILAALLFIGFKVRKILVQHKLGIKQSVIGQTISTILVAAVILFVCIKLASTRGFPWILLWIGLILGLYAYITNKTAIGRHLYAVGGNEKATALSGVKTRNVFWFAYANIGLLAGFAGILSVGRGKGMEANFGEGFEMDAIASCFIGGASAYGGSGKVSGMIIGALLMGVINQGMGIVGVNAYYQKVVKGLVLLVAVLFDVLSKRQKR